MIGVTYLSAPWCSPCKVFGPTLERVAEELNVEVSKVNVDLNPEVAVEMGILSVPATVWWKNGEYVKSKIGAMAEPALRTFIATL